MKAAMHPTKKVLAGMADKLHRDRCWRGPSCDDFTSEDWNHAEALWWFLSTPQPTGSPRSAEPYCLTRSLNAVRLTARQFLNDRWRNLKGYSARSGTWRYVGATGFATLLGVAAFVGGGGVSREARRGVLTRPSTPSSHLPRFSWVGWTGPTTTAPPVLPAVQPHPTVTGGKRVQAPRANVGQVTGDPWDCIRKYESGGTTDPRGANLPGGGYYQFLDSTWHAAGGTGQASDHSFEEQTARAHAWQAAHGWGQWSTAKRCGLM